MVRSVSLADGIMCKTCSSGHMPSSRIVPGVGMESRRTGGKVEAVVGLGNVRGYLCNRSFNFAYGMYKSRKSRLGSRATSSQTRRGTWGSVARLKIRYFLRYMLVRYLHIACSLPHRLTNGLVSRNGADMVHVPLDKRAQFAHQRRRVDQPPRKCYILE